MELLSCQRKILKLVSIVTGFGLLLCTISQVWIIDHIEVDRPVTITAHPNPELRAFWYDPLCDNTTLDSIVMNTTYCVYSQFDQGCKGNNYSGQSTVMVVLSTIFAALLFTAQILGMVASKDDLSAIGVR